MICNKTCIPIKLPAIKNDRPNLTFFRKIKLFQRLIQARLIGHRSSTLKAKFLPLVIFRATGRANILACNIIPTFRAKLDMCFKIGPTHGALFHKPVATVMAKLLALRVDRFTLPANNIIITKHSPTRRRYGNRLSTAQNELFDKIKKLTRQFLLNKRPDRGGNSQRCKHKISQNKAFVNSY